MINSTTIGTMRRLMARTFRPQSVEQQIVMGAAQRRDIERHASATGASECFHSIANNSGPITQ